jgi:hypothetical protein
MSTDYRARAVLARWGTRPLSEWTDDDGDVLWWRFVDGNCGEPPWVGSPLSDDWMRGIDNDYYTHWTLLPHLNLPATEQP